MSHVRKAALAAAIALASFTAPEARSFLEEEWRDGLLQAVEILNDDEARALAGVLDGVYARLEEETEAAIVAGAIVTRGPDHPTVAE